MRDCDIDNNADVIFANNGGYDEATPISYCEKCGNPIYDEDNIYKDDCEKEHCKDCFIDLLWEGKWTGEEKEWLIVED